MKIRLEDLCFYYQYEYLFALHVFMRYFLNYSSYFINSGDIFFFTLSFMWKKINNFLDWNLDIGNIMIQNHWR